jgi:hypothetical protein
MNAIAQISPVNKVVVRWVQKMANQRECKTSILDTGATSGAALEEDKESHLTKQAWSPTNFHFLQLKYPKGHKENMLKHKLHETAKEINIVPLLHSTLISVHKLADADYTTVFTKATATTYYATTTSIVTTQHPVLVAPQCKLTRFWKLPLKSDPPEATKPNNPQPNKTINVIFDPPSTHQSLLWYHAAVDFPTKETFINAVCAGNNSTWPSLTAQMINCHFPDSTEPSRDI